MIKAFGRLVVLGSIVFWTGYAAVFLISLVIPAERQVSFLAECIYEGDRAEIEHSIEIPCRQHDAFGVNLDNNCCFFAGSDCAARTSFAKLPTIVSKIVWREPAGFREIQSGTRVNLIGWCCPKIFHFGNHYDFWQTTFRWGPPFIKAIRALKCYDGNTEVSSELTLSCGTRDIYRIFSSLCCSSSCIQCVLQSEIGGIKKIGTYPSSDEKQNSRNAQYDGPSRYDFFIAFGFWLAGFLMGLFGLWRLLRHDNVALFAISLVVAALSGWVGATFL